MASQRKRETILTSSEDGSLRVWDVSDFKSQKQVIKPKLARPGRGPVTTCTWNHDNKSIAGGVGDGSIQIWNLKPGWGSRPDIHIAEAHEDKITGLKFSSDGRNLLSRSTDCSMKVWDLSQVKKPLQIFEKLPNNYAQTNVAFIPDEQLLLELLSKEIAHVEVYYAFMIGKNLSLCQRWEYLQLAVLLVALGTQN